MLIGMILMAWLTILIAPDTPIGKCLRSMMVIQPARWLSHVRPGHIMLMTAAVLIAGGAIYFGGGDAAAMISMGTPELLGWAVMFDVATYLDVVIAVSAVAVTVRLRPIAGFVAMRLPSRLRHRRVARAKRRPSGVLRHAANDDDGNGRWRTMFAA